MRFVIGATGASGAIYLQRLLDYLSAPEAGHELHLVMSGYARQVANEELEEGGLRIPESVIQHGPKSMLAPFASGSAVFDAMAVVPCSMGTMARIAHGTAEDLITRAADVFLKENRKLIIVPRETPWNLIHARNVVTLLETGATVIPASPSFYHRPQTIDEVVDSVVWRILDHMGAPAQQTRRWQEADGQRRAESAGISDPRDLRSIQTNGESD